MPGRSEPDDFCQPIPVHVGPWRGYRSWPVQPPPLMSEPKFESNRCAGAKFPPPVASETYVPAAPKATISANGSPSTSASWRGYRSWPVQPPPLMSEPKVLDPKKAGGNCSPPVGGRHMRRPLQSRRCLPAHPRSRRPVGVGIGLGRSSHRRECQSRNCWTPKTQEQTVRRL